jgi:glycosyltransferase involved in cell wall biosynthesis
MKVLHLATSDLGDGAGVAALRLHRALGEQGVASRMLVMRKLSSDPAVVPLRLGARLPWLAPVSRVGDTLEWAANQVLPQSLLTRSLLQPLLYRELAAADVVNLHAIHSGFDAFALLSLLAVGRPLVWTLHDMWAFTGHCSYAYDCTRWRSGCGQCPYLDQFVELRLDTSRANWSWKRWLYERLELVVVSPSRWLLEQARASPLLARHRLVHVPNGLDGRRFHPPLPGVRDRRTDRRLRLLVVAYNMADRRKGAHLLAAALRLLMPRREEIVLVSVGRGPLPADIQDAFAIEHHGFVADDDALAAIYGSADLLAFASRADNLPNVVLESLACGTPVVGFAVGGLPDMVEDGVTGFLTPPEDAGALAARTAWLLDHRDVVERLRAACARRVAADFSASRQATRYLELYRQLCPRAAT